MLKFVWANSLNLYFWQVCILLNIISNRRRSESRQVGRSINILAERKPRWWLLVSCATRQSVHQIRKPYGHAVKVWFQALKKNYRQGKECIRDVRDFHPWCGHLGESYHVTAELARSRAFLCFCQLSRCQHSKRSLEGWIQYRDNQEAVCETFLTRDLDTLVI